MPAEATALAPERVLRTRLNQDGWTRTDNPDFKAEYASSDTPWRVVQRVWTRYYRDHKGKVFHRREGVARCRDPRVGRWVYRVVVRDHETKEWVFLKPPPRNFDSLADAKGAHGVVGYRHKSSSPYMHRPTDWVRDDD